MTIDFITLVPITQFVVVLQLDMDEKIYIYFSEMKLHLFYTSQRI